MPPRGSSRAWSSAMCVASAERACSRAQLLRQEIHEGSAVGKEAESIIKAGGLLPDASLVKLLENALDRLRGQSFILDGYPRRATQAAELDRILQKSDGSPLSLVISLDVPDEVILQRIRERWIHRPSGRTYNLSFNPPKVAGKDDVTGEPLTQREDDNVDTFRKRLEAYHAETEPIKSFYLEQDAKRPSNEPARYFAVSGETSDYIWPFVRDQVFERGRFPSLA